MDIDHPEEDFNSPTEAGSHRRREALGIVLLVFGILFALSLLSSFFDKEWMGVIGKLLATFVYYSVGFSSLFVAYALLYVAIRCFQRQPWFPSPYAVAGFAGLFVGLCIFLQLVFPGTPPPLASFVKKDFLLLPKGGILGFHLEGILYKLFGTGGIVLLEILLFSLSLLAISSLSYKEVGRRIQHAFGWFLARFSPQAKVPPPPEKGSVISSTSPSTTLLQDVQPANDVSSVVEEDNEAEHSQSSLPPVSEGPVFSTGSSTAEPVIRPRLQVAKTTSPPQAAGSPPAAHYIQSGLYQVPSLEILQYRPARQADLDRKAMLDLAQRLEKSLADYQVKGRVTQIHPGPVVTMFEFAPAAGTKLSKITALSSDLAMILEAQRVRIVAPIPGKAVVGIEVPNVTRETVYAKEILSDATFAQSKSMLTLALGKDIVGVPVCVDLAKMPHLLIAGTTGSGKSVAVNVMIASILFRASPEEVKVIMIDPKMLELSIYEGIPHLLLPVVTDPKKANLALKWAVDEMDRRYDVISKAGVRDIASYNRKVELQESEPKPSSPQPQGMSEEPSEPLHKLPFIVVIIDEFADLMMVASKEVEVSVARIAQKARAAGIHLVLATQRPSVDVITGLIKANFPSRIAFQVASRIDSRTILDTQGAESLLGMGDMLFTDRGQALRRIHGALITDDEIHKLVEHLKKQGSPIYDMDILKPREGEEDAGGEEDMEDELYDQAVRIVAESQQASISMVQRRLRIGYNRAARMIERMEREGVVSKADGAKGREVLVRP